MCMMLRLQEYHRPGTFQEALALLARPSPVTHALAGGTSLTGGLNAVTEAVVDLRDLGLDSLQPGRAGAMVTLQQLYDSPLVPDCLREAARASAPRTIRVAATLGGSLFAPDGGHAIPTALSALGAAREQEGPLLLAVTYRQPLRSAFARVGRTPSDQPTVCAAACRFDDGSVRVAVGGVAESPFVFTADPGGPDRLEERLAETYRGIEAAGDWLAGPSYRKQVGLVLAGRALQALRGGGAA
jgi:CO/xanthine dehydrogenase FAD-binding subunit